MVDIISDIEQKRAPVDILTDLGEPAITIPQRNENALNNVTTVEQSQDETFVNLAKTRFSDEQIKEWENNPIGFADAYDFLEWSEILPGGGLVQAYDTVGLTNISKKYEKGEDLTESEQKTLNTFIDKTIEMRMRGFSYGGSIVYYGSQIPAFAIEFALTGGVGKAAQLAAVKTAAKVTEKAALKKIAGVTAQSLARSATMPAQYVPTYAETRLNDFMAVTDKGELIFKESKESPAKSALKAYGYTVAEVASEMSGAAIGKYIVSPIAKVAKTPLTIAANKLPQNVQMKLYQAYQKIQPNASITKVFSAAGWNGMLEELGEERISDVLRSSLDLAVDEDYTFNDFLANITPTKDQLLLEAGLVSIAGGVKVSADVATNYLISDGKTPKESAEIVNNMSAIEQENYINERLYPKNKSKDLYETDIAGKQIDATEQVQIQDEESIFHTLYSESVDRLFSISEAVKEAKKRDFDVPKGQDPYVLGRTFQGIVGVINQNINVNTTLYNKQTGMYEVTGKGLRPIVDEHIEKLALTGINKKEIHRDLSDYLIARRTIYDLENREDVEIAEKDILSSLETINNLPLKYGDNFLWVDNLATEIYSYQKRVLYNLVESGLITQELYDKLIKDNPNYIPFQRILDEKTIQESVLTKGVFTNANANKVIKKIHGSDKEIKDPIESIYKNTAKIIEISQRNNVAASLVRLSDILPEYIQSVKPNFKKKTITEKNEQGEEVKKEIYVESDLAPKDTITIRINGKRQYYRVSKPLLQAMENLSPVQKGLLTKILDYTVGTSASVLRAGATTFNPDFWIRNILPRDPHTAYLQSSLRPTPIDVVKGLFLAFKKPELYNDWQRNGGSFNSYMDLGDKSIEKAVRELYSQDSRLAYIFKHPLKTIDFIPNALEQATRLGVYSKGIRKGMRGVELALMSRDATLDFARGGSVIKKWNKYVPFLNAGVQSVDTLIRSFKNKPIATTLHGIATVTAPSIAITGYYLYAAPEEERKEYLEIPQWQKDIFWVFKTDEGWNRIQKPFSYGYLFGSVPERVMLWGYEGDKPEIKKFWEELAVGIIGSVSPIYDASSALPPILKIAIEDVTNYNFFTGRNIYPKWLDSLEPEQRYNKYTSEVAKELGKKFKISPAKIQNSIRGQFAGTGQYALDAGDYILNSVRKWNGEKVPEKPVTPSDIPIIKGFSVREPVGYSANSVNNFFDNLEESSQKYNTFRKLEGNEKAEYIKENQKYINSYKSMKQFYKRIRILGDKSDMIYDDISMSSERKVKELSKIGNEILDVAIEGNKFYKTNIEK